MKRDAEDSLGLPEELACIVSHEVRRLADFVTGGNSFISDDFLVQELALYLKDVPQSMNRVLKDYASITLGGCMQA